MITYLLGVLSGFGLLGLTIAALLCFGQLLPALYLFYRLGSHFFSFARRGREALYLERHVERVSQRLNRECPGAAPFAPKIVWVGPSDLATVRDGEVLICLSPGTERPINLVRAAIQYLHRGVVHESRAYMPTQLSRSLDLALARDVVSHDPEAQHLLTAETIAPEIQTDSDKGKWFGMMDRLMAKGFMTRLYLPELARFGRRLYPATPPSASLSDELTEFTYFVNKIARRWEGEEHPLQFDGATIRCAVILVAKTWKLDSAGDAYHWWRLLKDFREGADTVFLIGLTPQGILATRAIAARAVRVGLVARRTESRFIITRDDGQPDHRIVIQCAASPTIADVSATPEEEVENVLRVVIPQLADARIEIVAIARQVGHMTKVALRPRFGESDPDVLIRACAPETARRAKRELEGESVQLVPWDSRAVHYIAAALGDDSLALSDSLLIDANTNHCVVAAETEERLAQLRGSHGVNVRLAEQLTGFKIDTTTTT